MCEIYRIYVCPHTGDDVTWIPCTEPLAPERRATIEAADAVVEQIFDVPQSVDLTILSIRGRHHRFPVVGAPFIWPFVGTEHPLHVELYGQSYQPFRSEIADSYLNRLLAEGMSPDEAAERYLRADVTTLVRLDRLYEITIDRQRARDNATGYNFADLIESRFREEQLFLTPYHPTLTVSRHLAISIFDDLRVPPQCVSLLKRRMKTSFFPTYATPVHPQIARHFGLKWASETTTYPFHSEGPITFEQFVRKYTRCEANLELEEAIKAVARGDADARSRIEAVAATTTNSAPVYVALAQELQRAGLHQDAAATLRRAIDLDPEVDWAHQLLSDCLRQTGDHTGADDAERLAIALRPHRHALQFHLAHVMASRGAAQEAVELMRDALEFDPKNPNYLSQLSAWEAKITSQVPESAIYRISES